MAGIADQSHTSPSQCRQGVEIEEPVADLPFDRGARDEPPEILWEARQGRLGDGFEKLSTPLIGILWQGLIQEHSPVALTLILPGITLDATIDLARESGLPLEMRPITEAEVRDADEVWLSSSTKEVLPVTMLDGKPVGHGEGAGKPGPMLAKMRAAYQAAKAAL